MEIAAGRAAQIRHDCAQPLVALPVHSP